MLKTAQNWSERSFLVKANNPLDLTWGLERAFENACDKIFLVVGIIYLEKFLGKFCKNVLKILGKLFHADKWYFQPHGQNFVTKIWRTFTFLWKGRYFLAKYFHNICKNWWRGSSTQSNIASDQSKIKFWFMNSLRGFFSATLVFFQAWTAWYTLCQNEP